ncbi:uncharacterized protein DS421_20g678020 [Arachis hypogaea]|nr:uncharacterized protein DS421_20g678020 [Arachis hypogaea]
MPKSLLPSPSLSSVSLTQIPNPLRRYFSLSLSQPTAVTASSSLFQPIAVSGDPSSSKLTTILTFPLLFSPLLFPSNASPPSSRHCHGEKLNLSALHRSAALYAAASSAGHHQLWAALLLLFFPFPFFSMSLLHFRSPASSLLPALFLYFLLLILLLILVRLLINLLG